MSSTFHLKALITEKETCFLPKSLKEIKQDRQEQQNLGKKQNTIGKKIIISVRMFVSRAATKGTKPLTH